MSLPGSISMPPIVLSLAVHVACVPLAMLLSPLLPYDLPNALPNALAWVVLEGVLAAAAGAVLGLAPWWTLINLLFAPALYGALVLQWPAGVWLAAFVVFVLVYWSTFRTQVPLYLTHRTALPALFAQLRDAQKSSFRFMDLGCGCGGVLQALAREFPHAEFNGIESAPLPCVLAWWRAWCGRAGSRSVNVRWGDFWKLDFGCYDVVYAFLSPVPMERLLKKARREMRPGTLLISNTFLPPDLPHNAPPGHSVASDARGGLLHVWRM